HALPAILLARGLLGFALVARLLAIVRALLADRGAARAGRRVALRQARDVAGRDAGHRGHVRHAAADAAETLGHAAAGLHQRVDVHVREPLHLLELLVAGDLAHQAGRRAELHHHLAHLGELLQQLLDVGLGATRAARNALHAAGMKVGAATLLLLARG